MINLGLFLVDVIGAFYVLFVFLNHVLQKNIVCMTTKIGIIFCAIGLMVSAFFLVDFNYQYNYLSVFDFPVWGFKDLGIVILVIGVVVDYKRNKIL